MKPGRIKEIAVLAAAVISCVFLTTIASGQTGADTPDPIGKSPLAEEFDKKALDKLGEMTPEEVEALDNMLALALTLFYDREYSKALPIFRDVADRVETMDVMFWYGTCASKAGENEFAIKGFKQMLEIDPNLHRVRLELATVYFRMEQYEDARRELKTVLEAEPPEAVKNNIEKLLASIDAKVKRLYTNLRFSLGIQRDSNVSTGPGGELIDVPGGGTITLTDTQSALPDWVAVANFYGNALYDHGKKGGWMWETTGSFYQTHNLKYHQFDFTQWRVSTGPWLVAPRWVLKLPVGYADNIYEHDGLYDTRDFGPSYEYFFNRYFSLRGTFGYLQNTYRSSPPPFDRSGQDNVNRIFEINPNLYFNNRKDILSLFASHENLDAKELRWTFDAYNLAASYFKRLDWYDWDLEFYSRYKFSRRDYAAPALLWPAGQDRRDTKHSFYMTLTRNFLKRFFGSLSLNYIRNNSNTDLYDFDKYVLGFHLGVKL